MIDFINRKTCKVYKVLTDTVINATNECDGQRMVAYYDADNEDKVFVREYNEFHSKFVLRSVFRAENA